MKCRYSENDIALFVERDIAPLKLREIEAHLAACDQCREVAEELRETQSVFKSLRGDTVKAGVLAGVRTKVLAEVCARNLRPAWGSADVPRALDQVRFDCIVNPLQSAIFMEAKPPL